MLLLVNSPTGRGSSLAVLAALSCFQFVACLGFQFNVAVDHDMSGPTYGLEGKSSSTIKYDSNQGLNLGGTIADLLGPPLKIANGFGSIIKGNNMAGLGTSLKSGGALLGFDAKLLETAGAGNLLKGGLLLGGAHAKANVAGQLAGPKGQKIASIIEIPVKVVAMKDLAAGKALTMAGAAKAAGAGALGAKGAALIQQGHALKQNGLSQIFAGANEGVQNIGQMVQKTADNVNTAFKLLPLVWDMKTQEAIKQQEELAAAKGQQQQVVTQQQQQHLVSSPHQMSGPANSVGGGSGSSLLGGLTSLIPGLSSSALTGNTGFGAGPNPTYAALWNTTSPLTNLLMGSGANPMLLPLTSGPLAQAFAGMQPIGTHESASSSSSGQKLAAGGDTRSESYDFNFLPGLKYHETVSAQLPTFGMSKSVGPPAWLSGKLAGAGGKTSGQQLEQVKGGQQQQQQVQQQLIQEPVKQQQQTNKHV